MTNNNKTDSAVRPTGVEFLLTETAPSDAASFRLSGRLDATSAAAIWRQAIDALQKTGETNTVIDASGLEYCDGAGIGLLLELRRLKQERGGELEVQGLAERFAGLLKQFTPGEFEAERGQGRGASSPVEELGRATVQVLRDMASMVTFVGELGVALLHAARHPRLLRWRDAWLVIETAGVNAVPIVLLIGFIMGLVMAFQAATTMRQFGVEIFVADLVALAMLRELGPLMTGIIIAGRSSSAFAAEIGTMQINEEVNALTTLGIDPVRFLVVTRVLATTLVTPLLALLANLMGLIGGAMVLLSMGYPVVAYYNEVLTAIDLTDLLAGMAQAVTFGFLIASVGCLRGLQTRPEDNAVGPATTSAVVSSIVLIALADAAFSVIYFYLDI